MGITEAIKSRRLTTGGKKAVAQIDPATDKIIATFDSIKAAGEALGLKRYSHIGEVCNNGEGMAYGFKWKYLNDEDSYFVESKIVNDYHELSGLKKPKLIPKINRRKVVQQIDPITNEVIATFDGVNAAARALGKKKGTHIGEACNGLLETAYNFKWRYANKTDSLNNKQIGIKKPVYQVEPNTNTIINTFDSIKAAAIAMGNRTGSVSSISSVCRGKQNTAYGSKWCYVEDYIPPVPTPISST